MPDDATTTNRTHRGERVWRHLSQHLRPLDEASTLPLYQQLQRALREAIENRVLGPGRRAAAGARSRRGARRLAHHGAQGDRRTRRGRPADAPPGLRHVRQRSRREELLEAHLVLRRHARARPQAAQRVAQSRGRHGDAGRIAARCARAPARRSIASIAFATPTTRRWRSNTRPCSRRACLRSTRSKRRSTKRSNAPATGRCARCSDCAPCCSRRSRRSCSRRRRSDAGPAGRARSASSRTAARSSSRSPSIAATSTTSSPSSAPPS